MLDRVGSEVPLIRDVIENHYSAPLATMV